MKIEGKRTMKKSEAGDLLIKLGKELRESGGFQYPRDFGKYKGEIIPPDQIKVEVEYKEKDSKRKFEIELKWRGSGSSQIVLETKTEEPSFSDIKREMKQRLYEVEVALKSGDLESAKENFKRFNELNEVFEELAEPEWQDGVEVLTKAIHELERSLGAEDIETSKKNVDKLWKIKKAFHAKYKN